MMTPALSEVKSNWKACFSYVEELLGSAFAQGAVPPPDGIEALKKTLKDLGAEEWDSNRKVYIFGRLDLDIAIPAAQADIIPWWSVFTGRAYAGDLEGLRKVYDVTQGTVADLDSRPSLDAALTWISFPHNINKSYKNKIEPAVLQQLFEWGADANYDNGSWLKKAMHQCERNIIDVWLDNGASLKNVVTVINQVNGHNAELHTKLLDMLPGRGFYDSLDADTLLETKFTPDMGGTSAFKTIFNFKAQRVTEIYESPRQTQPVMQSSMFDDYSTTALEAARAKLEKITGKPVELGSRIEKKPFPRGITLKTPRAGS